MKKYKDCIGYVEGDGTVYHMFDMAAIESAEQGNLGVEFGGK